MVLLIQPEEELVRATDLQSDYASILDHAADRLVSVQRGRDKEDVTIWSRARIHRLLRMTQLQAALVQLAVTLAARLAGVVRPFPSELAWLSVLSPDDLAAFVSEFAETVSAVNDGIRDTSALDALFYEWHRSADLLQNRELQERMHQARPLLT